MSMTQKELKQTLKDKLKECDKDILIDIIVDVCSMYIKAKALIDISNTNCMQQSLNTIQTSIQEIDNFIVQKINTKLYDQKR